VGPPPSANGGRARDELYETVIEVCGWDPRHITDSARGRANAALKELRKLNPVPDADDLRLLAADLQACYPGIVLTPQALTNNFPDWTAGKLARGARR
jgi:hypothetical protein